MVEESQTQKYCSLYANKMHLVVMLIPYIEKELEKGKKITTILEDGLENEINIFMKKVILGRLKRNKIKKINWNKNLLSNEQFEKLKNRTVIIQGSYEYVMKINQKICDNKNLKIINCIDFTEFEENSREILEKHSVIINTSGEKKIPEIFRMNSSIKGILTKQP